MVDETESRSAPTEGLPEGLLAPGQVLGGRYQIKSQLGRGGMGEVWRAFDLKLRVEVALKALREDLFKSERRREALRREVRAAREVVSPNVCRIFDLIEVDGTELVSMEYVDGGTLLSLLAERGPLDLKEAQDIASQFLAGLEAIHQAGLVHRDVKPENIMITRAGRVVLMDFGLARQEDSGAGTVAGTPAYMAPEQAMGGKVDARADVYSAGVVLAEMVSPEGIKDLESRQSVWEGMRQEPARVPDTPWAPVLKKAVAKEPDQRHNSAQTLIRELEDVTLRVEGAEDLTPYPGLASFTEEDAEYFFGREAEVEAMWARLEGPARLLALVGPSGAGKTSFLRAGLIPSSPPGWSIVRCTPGNAPSTALGQALVPELSGDTEAIQSLIRVDEVDVAVEAIAVWRRKTDRALLIVDQFEELFTLNTFEVQKRFAALLARVPLEADADVLLCMRDDFLIRCHDHEALTPIFDALTPLKSPSGANLRRALMQPATKCGYRFEDDELVNEMLADVEGERGALPLLAFAMSRLWEKRDREGGLITRSAYHDIGGVGGALARHAEATIDRIGSGRIGHIREIFRNLVTAEGTRAVREWEELLSIFDQSQRSAGEEVLRQLIDARLLTSYEIHEEGKKPTRRVETIHESLLANWPRLVRWQTQDADSARLRDELRQAARTWDEHGRHTDRLWTGTAYREFAVWRERYRGGLSEIEESFAQAMTVFAKRRQRRRRLAVGAIIAVLLAGLAVVGSFWQRSVRETRRAEAAELFAFGQLELEAYPSAAIAYAIASLELADRPATRRLALEALWRGPPAQTVSDERFTHVTFTEDSRWLIQASQVGDQQIRLTAIDGSSELLPETEGSPIFGSFLFDEGSVFALVHRDPKMERSKVTLWLAEAGKRLAEKRHDGVEFAAFFRGWADDKVAYVVATNDGRYGIESLGLDGEHEVIGEKYHIPDSLGYTRRVFGLGVGQIRSFVRWNRGACRYLAMTNGYDVFVSEVGDHGLSEPVHLGSQSDPVFRMDVDSENRFVVSADRQGRIYLWPLNGEPRPEIIQGPVEIVGLGVTRDGRYLIANSRPENEDMEEWIWSLKTERPQLLRKFNLGAAAPMLFGLVDPARGQMAQLGRERETKLWRFNGPADAEPQVLLRGEADETGIPSFHPSGSWLVAPGDNGVTVWPLLQSYPVVIRQHSDAVYGLAFGPDGRWLASCSADGTTRIWPLEGEAPPPGRVLFNTHELRSNPHGFATDVAVSPDGSQLVVGTAWAGTHLVSVEKSDSRTLPDSPQTVHHVALSRDGRFAAASGWNRDTAVRGIAVWEVVSGRRIALVAEDEPVTITDIQFVGEDHLLASNENGLRRWHVESDEPTSLYEGHVTGIEVAADDQRVLLVETVKNSDQSRLVVLDLSTGKATPVENHGEYVVQAAFGAASDIVISGGRDGTIRVGHVSSESPFLLLGHEYSVTAIDVDPENRWIASASYDSTIRLWPMPDLSKPPLHTLPREELIVKLKTLTNLRVIRDEESATGWKLTHDPFPGWETVPEW